MHRRGALGSQASRDDILVRGVPRESCLKKEDDDGYSSVTTKTAAENYEVLVGLRGERQTSELREDINMAREKNAHVPYCNRAESRNSKG